MSSRATILARHHRNAPVARGPADDAVRPREVEEQVQVETVAQKRVAEARGAHVLLGVPVVPGEREGGIGRGAEKGEVYDPLDACGHRRVDGGGVLAHPVASLAGRDHEKGLYAVQGPPHRLRVCVRGFGGLRPRKIGSAAPAADYQPLAATRLCKAGGYFAADGARGARDSEEITRRQRLLPRL